jgi:hypothetical protein
MKQLIYFSIVILLFFISGCSKEDTNSVVFMITNSNSGILKNFQLKTSDNKAKTKEVVIPAGKTVAVRLYMDRVSGDGYYIMQYDSDSISNTKTINTLGYYSNGNSLDDEILVTLTSKSLIVHSVRNY